MRLLSCLVCVLVLTVSSAAWAASMAVSEFVVTTKVSKGKPIDAVHRISHRSVTALYCYSRTTAKTADQASIKHVWQRDGKVVKEVVMATKARQWRAYSTMPIGRTSVGSWRVDLLDADGELVKTVEFQVH